MALDLVQRYNTRDLAVQVDSGARTVLPGTNVSFTTDPVTGAITINASGGTGTVTSVGLAAPTGFTVSGSPVTTTGTLTFSYTAGYVGYTTTEQTKLAGIAAGATVGATWGVNLASIPANITSWAVIAPSSKADLNNPIFTGDPRAPTPATADNDTSIATTAFVKNQGYATTAALGSYVLKAGDTMTGQLQVNAQIRMRGSATTNPSTFMDMGQNPTGAAGDNDAYYYNRVGGIWFGTANVERGRMLSTGELRWTGGEIQSTNSNAYRMVQGNYGAIWRQDGSSLYLLFTASGNQYGSWNSLRPFTVDLVSGQVSIGDGLAFGSQVGASTTDLSNHIALYSTSMGFNVTSGRLNYVVPAANSHLFVVNGDDKMSISATEIVTANANLRVANGDIYTYRTGGTTGVIFLNSAGNRFLFYDGTNYDMPAANLNLSGGITLGTGKKLTKVTLSTAAPAGLADGELYLRY